MILAPLIAFALARDLRNAGFPQLTGQYWKTVKGVQLVQTYTGAKPLRSWAYIPTSDELLTQIRPTVVIARDNLGAVALTDKASATGATVREALSKLFLLKP